MLKLRLLILSLCVVSHVTVKRVYAEDEVLEPKVEENLGDHKTGSRTATEVETDATQMQLDGLSADQMAALLQSADQQLFQTEVNRMMKLIINSLYKNKEIFLRELISNASDAIDKIRLLSLTNSDVLDAQPELTISVKADKEQRVLHITDTGVGMTREELVKNLGTIAKSGTSDFLKKMADQQSAGELNDLIGQFGVGFYSAFLVSDRVVVTSKSNDGNQFIWESDSSSFRVVEDPRGNTLKRGTQVSLFLKEEAQDFLEPDTLEKLIKKYSQFINYDIFLWKQQTEEVEEPVEEEDESSKEESGEEKKDSEDVDVEVEEDKDKDKPKTKKVSKTTWNWMKQNQAKPIWTRDPSTIEDSEYDEFYKVLTGDTKAPLARSHFVAEGEVSFKSLLFVPTVLPADLLNNYNAKTDNIKLYVKRVFITDQFPDMLPHYLNFVRGIVDSDDMTLNVGREDLQQQKLTKVIKKKLVRKVIDMFMKLDAETYTKFWKEFSTNIKLAVLEDKSNKSRWAKLLRFFSSHSKDEKISLETYVKRAKSDQQHIFFVAASSKQECERSPFTERLIRKGYEVLYLVESVDEYAIQSLPEFSDKKFQNVAKEGLKLGDEEDKLVELEKQYEPLCKWLADDVLKDEVAKVKVSNRLTDTAAALVASQFGWTGNMERIVSSQTHTKTDDPNVSYYASQRKTLEINPRNPLIKRLLQQVSDGTTDDTTRDTAHLLYLSTTVRSGFQLKDTARFEQLVDGLLRKALDVSPDERSDQEEDDTPPSPAESEEEVETPSSESSDHDEL